MADTAPLVLNCGVGIAYPLHHPASCCSIFIHSAPPSKMSFLFVPPKTLLIRPIQAPSPCTQPLGPWGLLPALNWLGQCLKASLTPPGVLFFRSLVPPAIPHKTCFLGSSSLPCPPPPSFPLTVEGQSSYRVVWRSQRIGAPCEGGIFSGGGTFMEMIHLPFSHPCAGSDLCTQVPGLGAR